MFIKQQSVQMLKMNNPTSKSLINIFFSQGMAVLRLLRGFLGWDDFQKGLQMYVQRYKFKNAEMPELWQTFAEVCRLYKRKMYKI